MLAIIFNQNKDWWNFASRQWQKEPITIPYIGAAQEFQISRQSDSTSDMCFIEESDAVSDASLMKILKTAFKQNGWKF